jgi:hypothetical protein
MKSRLRTALVAVVATLALGALTAAPAFASGEPIVETTVATGVVGTEATANGTVNPNGATTKYYFEYGTTTSYGSKTAEGTIIGTEAVKVGKLLTGLNRKTGYHFRVVATNANGTAHGLDETFTTTALPEFAFRFPEKEKSTTYTATITTREATWQFSGGIWGCPMASISGQFFAGKNATATIVFTGCSANRGGNRTGCRTQGSAQEEIVTQPLEGTLVYTSKASKTVGIDFKAKTGTSVVHRLECVAVTQDISGSIVFPVTPVNKLQKSFTISSILSGQEYETEQGVKHSAWLEGEYWGKIGLGFKAALSASEVEIKA